MPRIRLPWPQIVGRLAGRYDLLALVILLLQFHRALLWIVMDRAEWIRRISLRLSQTDR